LAGRQQVNLGAVLGRLFEAGEPFDRVIRALRSQKAQALPMLVRLLKHPDPGWRRVSATALGRIRETPKSALPSLLELLSSPDAAGRVAALSAIEWLPGRTRDRAVPAVVDLLISRRVAKPVFTQGRAQVPRAVAAHFLSMHGGARGIAALTQAARHRKDPMIHHIDAALERGGAKGPSRSGTPPNKRLQPSAAGEIICRRG
jgi:hypothetical protein